MRAFRKKVISLFFRITEAHNNVKVLFLSGHRQRNRRNVPPTQSTPRVSLQLLRQEIDKKLTQVCTSSDKICQVGPPGPQRVSRCARISRIQRRKRSLWDNRAAGTFGSCRSSWPKWKARAPRTPGS